MGHVGGLPQFGPEAMAADGLPVYASEALAGVIRESAIWRPAAKYPVMGHVDGRPAGDARLLPDGDASGRAPSRDEWGAGTFTAFSSRAGALLALRARTSIAGRIGRRRGRLWSSGRSPGRRNILQRGRVGRPSNWWPTCSFPIR